MDNSVIKQDFGMVGDLTTALQLQLYVSARRCERSDWGWVWKNDGLLPNIRSATLRIEGPVACHWSPRIRSHTKDHSNICPIKKTSVWCCCGWREDVDQCGLGKVLLFAFILACSSSIVYRYFSLQQNTTGTHLYKDALVLFYFF